MAGGIAECGGNPGLVDEVRHQRPDDRAEVGSDAFGGQELLHGRPDRLPDGFGDGGVTEERGDKVCDFVSGGLLDHRVAQQVGDQGRDRLPDGCDHGGVGEELAHTGADGAVDGGVDVGVLA